jgi:hypothetical protein
MYWRPVAMKTWWFLPHKGLMSRFCLLQKNLLWFSMSWFNLFMFVSLLMFLQHHLTFPYVNYIIKPQFSFLLLYVLILILLIGLATDLSLCKFFKTINFFINTFYYLFLFNLSCFLSSLLYLTKFGLILLLFFWLPRLSS